MSPFDGIQRDLSYEPYQYPWKLYTMHFFFAFTARMWDMGIILLLADLTNNSIAMAAISGLLGCLILVLFMSSLGNFLDKTNRLNAARIMLGVKFITLTTAYVVCAVLAYKEKQNIPFNHNLVYLIPVISAIATLSFSTISQSVEKDWIVVLSNHDSAWLSNTNSIMTQIDALCNSVAPAITGFLFLCFSQSQVAIILLGINAIATFGLYIYMSGLYHSWPSLATRQARPKTNFLSAPGWCEGCSEDTRGAYSLHTVPTEDHWHMHSGYFCFDFLHNRFHDFFHSGCAGVMIAYALLYMTVLSFGSLMTVYLRWSGLSDHWIGVARGVNAFSGFLGATVFPFFIQYFGLYQATSFSIVYQWIFVTIAASSFFLFPTHIVIVLLCVCVILSRAGLWMFDLGVRQIAQETIPEHSRGVINGQWKSMTAFFEMTAYVVALTIQDPSSFWILTTMSATMVGIAMILYQFTRPDLFPARHHHYQPVADFLEDQSYKIQS